MIINSIKEKAKRNVKKIILPEITDERVLKAASVAINEGIAEIILIGNDDEIFNARQLFDLNKATFINPSTFSLTDTFIEDFYESRKHKGITYHDAEELVLNNYMYFACMLLKFKIGDGIVSGASHPTIDVVKPSLEIIKASDDAKLVSAFFLMDVPNCEYGDNGVFLFSDAGLNQNPSAEELAEIAASSAKSFYLLTKKEPIVAMISHSTKGSAKHTDVSKVVAATKLVKEKYPNLKVDGELQVDAAIVPEVAEIKAPGSEVAGKANILIFPDLDAGNAAYKLVERLAHAKAYGPISQAIKYPVNDLSRGCSVDDIVGVIAITALQAQNK